MLVTNALSKKMMAAALHVELRLTDRAIDLFGLNIYRYGGDVSHLQWYYGMCVGGESNPEPISAPTVYAAKKWASDNLAPLKQIVGFFRWNNEVTVDEAMEFFQRKDDRWFFNQRSNLLGILTVAKTVIEHLPWHLSEHQIDVVLNDKGFRVRASDQRRFVA